MSFSDILRDTVERVEGAVSALIIGMDGMPVEEYAQEKLISLDELSAEASQLMKDVSVAARGLRLGEAQEFSIVSDLCGILMRKINPEYYMALIIRPDGNYGKGRYVLRSVIPTIKDEF
jgi:predicted regulator of Ras-like GTPase activity (Roadblock/LC7/MglB family)